MKKHTFSGEVLILVFNFLTCFRLACNINGGHKDAVVWCFHFYFTGQACSFVQPRLTRENSITYDTRTEMLTTNPDMISFLLKTYATDELIDDGDAEFTSYGQNTENIETETSGQKPYNGG